MIYEMRTYDLKPRALPEVEQRFGEAYEKRKKYSELAAFWHTEIGPLNQIIHVWGYKDMEERNRIREAAVKDGVWPPKISEFIVSQKSEIMVPFSFMKPIQPAKVGQRHVGRRPLRERGVQQFPRVAGVATIEGRDTAVQELL